MRGNEGYWEAVTGRIVNPRGRALEGITVNVYDKDVMVDDHLGKAVTGANGKFRVEFTQADYTPLFSPGEGRPDIYLKLTGTDGRVHKTKVQYDLSGHMVKTDDEEKGGLDGEIEVMNLGDVEFPDADVPTY
ncbi:MAG: hypothetical protein ABI333_10245 [bacterium]